MAETRSAVRAALAELREAPQEAPAAMPTDTRLVLVACSGGPDSLALAAATAFEAPKQGWRAGAVVVDHQLQPGSAELAERAAGQCRELGLDPVIVKTVEVGGFGGPEAAARTARYRAFREASAETGAEIILTAHTRDDQAEQVLLALARGSGVRSIAGIPRRRGLFVRPLLDVPRESTVASCAALGLAAYDDPTNSSGELPRSRVRTSVLPRLEAELGTGVRDGLARTAVNAAEDADALDAMALEWAHEIVDEDPDSSGAIHVDAPGLAAQPPAIRQRIVRLVVSEMTGAQLSRVHALAVCDLAVNWHGQGPVDVPTVQVTRSGRDLLFLAATDAADALADADVDPVMTTTGEIVTLGGAHEVE